MSQPTKLMVCPTSHMDWDWLYSFEGYYKSEVQGILDSAVSLFGSQPAFLYNLAEIGWFRRYLVETNGKLPAVPNLLQVLCLMGGAITSPDNLVCDGEAFVRAYLVGRQWAQSVGLGDAVTNVAWLPDDFGHDPELPVILSAMGLTAVGLARVPGAFPLFAKPLNGSASLACSLIASGVAFNWQAGDGSTVLAHFMPNTYGVPFSSGSAESNAAAWLSFVQSEFLTEHGSYSPYYMCSAPAVAWPGDIAFAPAGGDFAVPDSNWVDGVADFNNGNNGTTAEIGTFAGYVSQLPAADLQSLSIDPSNFYTGYFGSRPELKILQARASSNLVAAETASSLIRLGSSISSTMLDALDAAIWQVWDMLAPSTHHDFVTGTSPDEVYRLEQLPMLSAADKLAKAVYRQAVQLIADSIEQSSGESRAVAVYNPVGVERVGGVFKLERGTAVTFDGSTAAQVQPLADGGLLVQAPTVPSLGYVAGTVTFNPGKAPNAPTEVSGDVTIDNGTIAIIVSESQLWAITSIAPEGGANVLPKNEYANLLQLYTDDGNLYQYGNELLTYQYPPNSPPTPVYGTFAPQSGTFTAGRARQTEFGPLRWRVEAELNGPDGITYLIVYSLIAGESLVRISVTGSAPSGTTVVTSFPAIAADGTPATHLTYGTAHHFHEDNATAYWSGPTFKATHNFLLPTGANPGTNFAPAAIYHNGMPAWACAQGQILGSLFRNTPGAQRAANGTDFGTHTQRFALRISSSALDPSSGTPLAEALQIANPLRAAIASNNTVAFSGLNKSCSLASTQPPALVRVVRPMGEVPSAAGNNILAQVALRIYVPDANGQASDVAVTMPVLSAPPESTALITALEQPAAGSVTVGSDNVLSVPVKNAITTVAVTVQRQSG